MSKKAPVTSAPAAPVAAPESAPTSAPTPAVNPAALLVEQLQKERAQAEEQIARWITIRDLKTSQLAMFVAQPAAPNRAARRRAGS